MRRQRARPFGRRGPSREWRLPPLFVLAFIALIVPRFTEAAGQSRDENRQQCGNDNPDISIAACTALIESGPDPQWQTIPRVGPVSWPTRFLALDYAARAEAYYKKQSDDLAIRDYDQATALVPDDWGAFQGRGKIFLRKREYNRAIRDFNEAIRQKPAEAFGAYIGRGDAYLGLGQHDSPLGQLARQQSKLDAFTEDPNQSSRAVQEFDQAIRDFNQAIRLKPNLAFAFQKRGFVYFVKGEYDRAIRDYTQAIALDPNASYTSTFAAKPMNEMASMLVPSRITTKLYG